ncbi:MAG: extracellular solute-binding protein [Clostridiales bacterium]|nr:extracellular solute-binding protein [Clostridiales bacterium]
MKKYVRNVLAVVLTCSMILPLAACKGKKKGGKQKKVQEDDPYFMAEETPLELEIDKSKKLSYKEIYNVQMVGDKLIGTYNIQYEMPDDLEEQITEMYMNAKEDEQDQIYEKIMELYAPYSEMGVIMFDLEGNIVKKAQGDLDSQLNAITALPDGGYVSLASNYDMGECKESYSLAFLDENLEPSKEIELDSELDGMWGGRVYPLDNGNYLIGTYSGVFVVDKNGKLLGKDSVQDMNGDTLYKVDGKYYVLLYEYDEVSQTSKCTLNEVDPNTGKVSRDGKEVSTRIWSAFEASDGYYMNSSNGISKIDLFDKKDEGEMILDWNWTDLNRASIQYDSVVIKSADEIYFLKVSYNYDDDPGAKYSGSEVSLVKLSRQEKNPHAGKTIIQIGAIDLYSDKFMDYIVSYNTDSKNKSRILIKDYGQELYDTEDYNKGAKELADKVYLDMLAGEGPDILLNFSSFSQFNNDDVLVDLNSFIDGENGFNRDDYFDNVFRAFELKGKMYQIPVCVDVHGFIANRDFVGDRDSWTYDEFMSIGDSLPENVSMMEELSCEALLSNLISVSGDAFIDYEKKTVNFDSEDFRKALEIAKKYGTLHPSNEGGHVVYSDSGAYYGDGMSEYVDPMDKVKEGMQVMASAYFYNIRGYAECYSALNEKAVFLGAPAPEASGMSAQPMLTLAIAKSCASQEEAWDFIRFMFEKDQQIEYANNFWSVPLLREALDEKNKSDIEEYQREKEDAKQWDPDFYEEYYKFDLNEEMAEGFVKLVEGIRTITSTDPGIMMIVNEEAPGFFENQRSAEDVCKNIQNRASTLLHER